MRGNESSQRPPASICCSRAALAAVRRLGFQRAGVVLMLAGGSLLLEAQNSRLAPPVEFTQAQTYTLGADLELPGTVESLRKAQVATQVEGLVVELLVRGGDRVKRGQELARLDTSVLDLRKNTLQADLVESEARLRSAEAKYQRAKDLFEDQLIAAEELDNARFEREALEARSASLHASIAEVELGIRQSVIRAPFDGAVTKKLTEVGQWVQEGAPVVGLLALDELEVVIDVPEVHIGRVQLGQTAQVKLGAFPTSPLPGKVSVMVPEADPDARTFPVKVRVSSRGGLVRTGMMATVSLSPANPRKATIVPKDALVSQANGWIVFALRDDNTVQPLEVVMGEGIGQWVEVEGKVTSGDRVVTRGNERLRPGQTVQPLEREYPQP